MSHFFLLALVEKSKAMDLIAIEAGLKDVMKKYQEATWFDGGKWDWWQIGGRWTGELDGYQPEKDRRNMKVCWLCAGTGKQTDGMAVKDGCNGCQGTGIQIKWPTKFARHEGDVVLLSELKKDPKPFAILTPDGKWYERGEMGWFGIVSNEREETDWEATRIALLAKHKDCLAVVVDCHI